MKLIHSRTYNDNAPTLSDCFVANDDNVIIYKYKALELPYLDNQRLISCIKEGVYKVTKRQPTRKFNYVHFILHDVEGRSHVLIHRGNYLEDTEGCILAGIAFADINNDGVIDVTSSKVVLDKLVEIMPEEFEIIITKRI
jgi:hypothetical protein